MRRIDTLWAWVTIEADGKEAVILESDTSDRPDTNVMIGPNRKRIEGFREDALVMADGQPVRLVCFMRLPIMETLDSPHAPSEPP